MFALYLIKSHRVRYDMPVKSKTKPLAEYGQFQSALRSVLQVSKSDLNRMLAEEKIANRGKPKRGPKPKHKKDPPETNHHKLL